MCMHAHMCLYRFLHLFTETYRNNDTAIARRTPSTQNLDSNYNSFQKKCFGKVTDY